MVTDIGPASARHLRLTGKLSGSRVAILHSLRTLVLRLLDGVEGLGLWVPGREETESARSSTPVKLTDLRWSPPESGIFRFGTLLLRRSDIWAAGTRRPNM